MKIAYLIKKNTLVGDPSVLALLDALRSGGEELYDVRPGLQEGTDLLLSFGGDGTFLSAASIACKAGVPILGINLGRLGFLSENEVNAVAGPILDRSFHIEERSMLQVLFPEGQCPDGFFPYALNEVVVRRQGTGTLALDVTLDSEPLPTYWADGILVSTSSGSTAYSLSVGGPICRPDVDAFILAPIAPHNLNLRPLVLPQGTDFRICGTDRKGAVLALSLDNRDYIIKSGTQVDVTAAPFKLKRAVLGESHFIKALREKLLWGEDVRNA